MATFYGKEIPWIPAQLNNNSDFCHLESYLYAIRNDIITMTTDEIKSLVCSIICDKINKYNGDSNSPKIMKDNLTLNIIKRFLSKNSGNNLYKFGGNDVDEFSFPAIFRVLDYYDIQELKLFCQYIYTEVFDPLSSISWNDFAHYCRSDHFIYSTSLELLSSAFINGIRPQYINSETYAPWTIPNQETWDSIDGYDLMMAACFLFSWNRCKSRLINHKELYASCKKLAKEACTLLLDNQNADGSWDSSTPSSNPEFIFKLLPTSYAALALSLCHDELFSSAIQSAHNWLLCRLADDQFLNDEQYAAYDTIVMDAIIITDENDGQDFGKVSFTIDPYLLPENGPRLPRPHISFLHLSDIHFSTDMDNGISVSIRKELVSHINQLVKNGTKITDLIITGDFRHAKSSVSVATAIDDAVYYINELAQAARISSTEHIHLVPGNHDIKRTYLKDSTVDDKGNETTYHDLYREQYFAKKGLFPDEAFKKFGSQIYFFRRIALRIYNKEKPWKNAKIHSYRYVDGTVFLYLNTAVFHHDDSDRGKLIVGVHYVEELLVQIKELYPDAPIVVLAHHSPDYFDIREKINLERVFLKYPISLYLCGDAHTPWWRMTNGHLEFTAGCVKDENGSQAEFLYGNAANYQFTSFLWDDNQGWGEFSAFNTSLNSFLRMMNMIWENSGA